MNITRKITLLAALLSLCISAHAQFRRTSDGAKYPYVTTLEDDDVFIIGRPGVTNFNFAKSNMLSTIGGVTTNGAAYQAFLSTNGWTTVATNIAAYQAFIATNNFLATSTNIAAYQAFLATNNFLMTSTNIANSLFVASGLKTNQFTTNTIGEGIVGNVIFAGTSNHVTGDLGVAGTFGTFTATANTLDVTTTIHGVQTNAVAVWDANGFLTAASGLIGPTNTAIVGQVLHATSTGGATKWDYVNQALTNTNPRVPDFTLPVNYWVTNAAFLFLPSAGVDTTGKKLQVTDCIVTNSTTAAVAVTFPATIHVTGTAFLTNVTVFHFRTFAGFWTNCACEPVW